MGVYDVPAMDLIELISKDLKENKKVEEPAFIKFIKTGAHRERAPHREDWFYIRTASVLRRVYIDGPVGTQSLRTYYGGKKNRGTKPNKFRKSSGKLVRTCLQSLEKLGFLEKEEKEGRKVSGKGQKYLNEMAKSLQDRMQEITLNKEKERMERLKEKEQRTKIREEVRKMTEEVRKDQKKEKIVKKKEEKKEHKEEKKEKGKKKK
ncbi:MAG TPA: 30S ribosomal protein S19e [archaeon]|nr:30S ribosomal protein S19e [archaeon]